MNSNNGQLAGAGWEQREDDRKVNQARTTAYGHRRKDEIVTVDDLHAGKRRKRQLERRMKNEY